MNNCIKCGNPEKMYWCEYCEINGENEDRCDHCCNPMTLDEHYHDECNPFPKRATDGEWDIHN